MLDEGLAELLQKVLIARIIDVVIMKIVARFFFFWGFPVPDEALDRERCCFWERCCSAMDISGSLSAHGLQDIALSFLKDNTVPATGASQTGGGPGSKPFLIVNEFLTTAFIIH